MDELSDTSENTVVKNEYDDLKLDVDETDYGLIEMVTASTDSVYVTASDIIPEDNRTNNIPDIRIEEETNLETGRTEQDRLSSDTDGDLPLDVFKRKKNRRTRENENVQKKNGYKEISKKLEPAYPVKQSPGETATCPGKEAVTNESTPSRSRRRVRKPPTTPEMLTPSSGSRPKKARRSLKLGNTKMAILVDSGSEFESAGEDEEENVYNMREERFTMRQFRYEVLELKGSEGCEEREHDEECNIMNEDIVLGNGTGEPDVAMGEERVNDDGVVESLEQPLVAPEYKDLDVFTWSADFSSFSGQEEKYLRTPGPTMGSQDPVQIFMRVWDEKIMEEIVKETNRYAWQTIAPLTETENGLPKYLDWTETTVAEMYRYFAMLINMSICYRRRVKDYWITGSLEMPALRRVMSRTRFQLITRFLHFVDNSRNDLSLSLYEKKIIKILPIIKHCNGKFGELYIPSKHLSLDESLLLWKGRLSWAQCIRTKPAQFGIKSFELCEATTGYQLRCLLYAGKNSSLSPESIHAFKNSTAKIVLELMNGYLDVGHTLVMDNWYNQLSLTRFLKRRHTDVIGTMNRRRINIPDDIKSANESCMQRGQQVARHCGDISLIAWKDVKLVTAMSTHHNDLQLPIRRILKPSSIIEYNKYMGGVDSKEQKLSMYPMERTRGQKWYMKVFKRLLNTSLLNTYIIYTKNPMSRPLTHREFRYEVACGLLERFSVSAESLVQTPVPACALNKHGRRLQKADHFPAHTDFVAGKNIRKQKRCVRCTAAGRRSMVTLMCTFCNVPLCVGPCWAEYHNLIKL